MSSVERIRDRAAVGDQPRYLQANGVVHDAHGLLRWFEEGEVDRPRVQHQIKFVGRALSCAIHERQLTVQLAHHQAVQLAGPA